VCLAAAVGALIFLQSCAQPTAHENVIFITVDTLRADHLGCYGYPRQTSPAIDELAKTSIVFDRCVSQATSTMASHASMFTSLYPPSHGVATNAAALSPDIPSLIRVFADNGYYTGAIISSIIVRSPFGLNQGFQEYDEELGDPELNREAYRERRADATTNAAIEWLRRNKGKKVFLWIHYIDPHGPYYPPEEYRTMFVNDEWYEKMRELPIAPSDFVRNAIPHYQALFDIRDPAYYISQYDAEIRFTDDQLGRLFSFMGDAEWMSRTITVLTSDHGETLTEREHPFFHGTRTYDEQAVIPLIMHFPDITAHSRITEQVMAIDIVPTILDKLGLAHSFPVHGRSLMSLIRSQGAYTEKPAVIFSDHGSEFYEFQVGAQKSITTREWKYTQNSWDGSEELYDLKTDPAEKFNLAGNEAEMKNTLRKMLEEWEQPIKHVPVFRPKISQETIDQMESLGYVVK
jgi:arylsulfatase A-like enzyme